MCKMYRIQHNIYIYLGFVFISMNAIEELFTEFKKQISMSVSNIPSASIVSTDNQRETDFNPLTYFDQETVQPNSIIVQFDGPINTDPIVNNLSPSLKKLCQVHIDGSSSSDTVSKVYFTINPRTIESITDTNAHVSFTSSVKGNNKELLLNQLSDYQSIIDEVYTENNTDQVYKIIDENPDNFTLSLKKSTLFKDSFDPDIASRLSLIDFLTKIVSIISISDENTEDEYIQVIVRSVYSSFENVAQVNSPVLRQRGKLLKTGLNLGEFVCPSCKNKSLRNLYRYTHYCHDCYAVYTHNTMSLPKFIQSESFEDMSQKVTEDVERLQENSDTVPIPESDLSFTLESGTSARVYLYGKEETATALPGRTAVTGPILLLVKHNIGIPYSFTQEELLIERTLYKNDLDSTHCTFCNHRFSEREPTFSGPFTVDVSETHQLQLSHKALFCESCKDSLQVDLQNSLDQIPTEDIFSYII